MTSVTEKNSRTGWIAGIVVVVAIIGLLLLARGPADQDRSGAMAPSTVVTIRA
jgi:hypothetical protein